MAQVADYNIANANGATVRADINAVFLAVSSTNSGTSEPSTMYAFMLWVDTTTNLIKLRNAANGAWITLGLSVTASNTVDINGGAIDGTAIGASSATTGAFTTLTATGAFTSLGIDDNADANAITISSDENVSFTGNVEVAAGKHYSGATGNDLNIVYPSGRSLFIKEGSTTTVTMDNVNNVGIGTATPNEAGYGADTSVLSVQGASADNFGVLELITPDVTSANRLGEITFGNLDGGSSFASTTRIRATRDGADNSSDLSLWTTTTGTLGEKVRITSPGKFVVGDTSALNGGGAIGSFVFGGAQGLFISTVAQATGEMMGFVHQKTTVVGTIAITSSATSYNTSSDARLKNVLGDAKGLEIVNQLNPVNFEWKESGEIQDGLIAQEVEEIVPNAVSENSSGYYQMDYSKLVTPLIKAVQEQQEQIEILKKQIETLKN